MVVVAVDLSGATMTFRLLGKDSNGTQRITLERGRYQDKVYHRAVILSGSIVLEGEGEPLCLGNAEAIYVHPEGIRDRIAALLESEEIYMRGMAAIPEGQERHLIEKLLS